MNINTVISNINDDELLITKIRINGILVILLTGNNITNFLDLYNISKTNNNLDDIYFNNSVKTMRHHGDIMKLSVKSKISTVFVDDIFNVSEVQVNHLTSVLTKSNGFIVGFSSKVPKGGYWYELKDNYPEIWL